MGSLLWGILILLCMTLGVYDTQSEREGRTDGKPRRDMLSLLKAAAPWIPNLAIVGTLLLATPAATEFRYAYSLACCIPLYLGIMLTEQTVSGNQD